MRVDNYERQAFLTKTSNIQQWECPATCRWYAESVERLERSS